MATGGGPDWSWERELWRRGYRLVAGVDEAGRGPLAGPVVAAAVILPPGLDLPGVDDSKRLGPQARAEAYRRIRRVALAVGVGHASPREIDRLDILRATHEAMRRAIRRLRLRPDAVLVDGRQPIPGLDLPQQAVVGGDGRSVSIAAASIVAKVWRDRLMAAVHLRFPQYGFDRHKGYPTPEHREALARWGETPLHRRRFRH